MPSFSDITELETLILEIVESQSATPKQMFQIRQYYMHAKEMHAQGNILLAREIMRVISGIPAEIQGLVEYHFKSTGYAEALLFASGEQIIMQPVKSAPEPYRKVIKTELVKKQNEEVDKGDGDNEIFREDLAKKEVASFDDF